MAVLLLDNFDRDNSTSVVGPPQIGPAPVARLGTFGISGNALYSPGTGAGWITWDLGTPDVDISITTSAGQTSTRYAQVVVGVTNTGGDLYAWGFGYDDGKCSLVRLGSGAAWDIATSVLPAPSMPFTTRLVSRGGWLYGFIDSTLAVRYQVDLDPAGTAHGARLSHSALRIDSITAATSSDTAGLPGPAEGPGAVPVLSALWAGQSLTKQGFLYKGRDTKGQDTTGEA